MPTYFAFLSFFYQRSLPLVACFLLCISVFSIHGKQRVIILTDISGPQQEPDDMESMVRLLLYSNEFDIEGLIATSSCWRANDPIQPEIISTIVNTYGKMRENLLKHAPGYPEAQQLLDLIKTGNGHSMTAVGNGKTSAGSKCIIDATDHNDNRPIWVCVWGGAATIAQALFDVKNTRSASGQEAFVKKLRIYDLSGQDDAGAWICHTFPDIFYIRSQFQWRAFSNRVDGIWVDSRGADEKLVTPPWFKENVIENHGQLGALYPLAKYLYEGDTPTFLNLIDNGLTNPEHVEYGGWGGRFLAQKQQQVRTGSENSSVKETQYDPYQMFSDASDLWLFNTTQYNNIYCALFRWRTACQNDFAARMDWCTAAYAGANHPPVAIVNDDSSRNVINYTAQPGSQISLNASKSADPDNDTLQYTWWIYPEAGTYKGLVPINDSLSNTVSIKVPSDAERYTIHVILTLSDNGTPPLHAYRRIVITCDKTTSISAYLPFRAEKYSINNSSKSDKYFFSIDGKRVTSFLTSTGIFIQRKHRNCTIDVHCVSY
jgi:hypothetical protein